MSERIPDINDRRFPNSIGHWTGDAYWDPETYLTQTGMIAIDLEEINDEKTIALQYPNINLPKEQEITFSWIETGKGDINYTAEITMWLSDGMNSMEIETTFTNATEWTDPSEVTRTLGPEWDKTQITLFAKVRYADGDPFTYLFDNFSAKTFPKTQYLPIMGVG